jgi:chromosome partitioning protein
LARSLPFWHRRRMGAIHESCSVCGKAFEAQFRWQMEERAGGFWFFCSQACHQKDVFQDDRATCDACHKTFKVELAMHVLATKNGRKHVCSDACRAQVLAEADGKKLGATELPEDELPPVLQPSRASSIVELKPRTTNARRLAVFNHKGGTGKTTTSVSLAAAFAQQGKRVLLVDTDSQGNVAASLGIKSEKSLYHVLVMGLRIDDAVVNVRPNLDLLPSNETLAAAELYLAGRQNRDRILRDRLAPSLSKYDVIVLDCSPSLSLMNQNALVFAEGIVVPVACDYLSLVGVRQVVKTVKSVNQHLHHPVEIEAVLPTFFDGRARICRDALDTLRQHFGPRCYEPVRSAIKVKEAPAQGKTIFEHAPESSAADDYLKAAQRLLGAREKATPLQACAG